MKYFAKLCFMISGNKNYKFNDYGIPYLDLQEFENLKKDIKDFKDLISAYESNNADSDWWGNLDILWEIIDSISIISWFKYNCYYIYVNDEFFDKVDDNKNKDYVMSKILNFLNRCQRDYGLKAVYE